MQPLLGDNLFIAALTQSRHFYVLAHNCTNQNTLTGGYTVVLKRKGAGEIYCSVEVRPVTKARRQYLISANHLTAALSTHTSLLSSILISLYANWYSKLQNYEHMYIGHEYFYTSVRERRYMYYPCTQLQILPSLFPQDCIM